MSNGVKLSYSVRLLLVICLLFIICLLFVHHCVEVRSPAKRAGGGECPDAGAVQEPRNLARVLCELTYR